MVTAADKVAEAFLCTEDSAGDAIDTLRRVVEHLLKAIDENIWVDRFALRPAPAEHQRVLSANRWKSTNPRHEPGIRELCRYIATQLASLEIPRFVFFHYDGDRRWSEQADSENREKFETIVRTRVKQSLLAPPPPRVRPPPRTASPPPPAPPRTEPEVDLLLGRLVEIVPFYSMESWLFRDFARLREYCAATCGRHLDLIRQWQANAPALDEVEKPKDVLECIRDDHNHELAGAGFQREELYLAETSLHDTVERLRAAPGLLEALRRTAES